MTAPYEIWADIRMSGSGNDRLEISSKAASTNTGYGYVRYGVGSAGEPHLLVPCASGQISIPIDPTDKLVVSVKSLTGPDGRQNYIDLICRDILLEKVFSELCVEVMRRLDDGESPASGVTQAIEDFKALLVNPATIETSKEKILGLIGELFMLYRMASLGIESPPLWLGPWEQRHDFRGNSLALEVKSSGRSDASKVSIHGIDQLSPPEGGRLLLTLLRFEEDSGGQISVSYLYHLIRKKITDYQRLNDGLSRIGCENPDAANWNRYKFTFQSLGVWEIINGFPRITAEDFFSGSLPPGISKIQYSLDLSVAGAYMIHEHEMDSYLKEMANA